MQEINFNPGPKVVIILPFLLFGMDSEELVKKVEEKITKYQQATFSTISSNDIRNFQRKKLSETLNL
jgi:hypothetical protein